MQQSNLNNMQQPKTLLLGAPTTKPPIDNIDPGYGGTSASASPFPAYHGNIFPPRSHTNDSYEYDPDSCGFRSMACMAVAMRVCNWLFQIDPPEHKPFESLVYFDSRPFWQHPQGRAFFDERRLMQNQLKKATVIVCMPGYYLHDGEVLRWFQGVWEDEAHPMLYWGPEWGEEGEEGEEDGEVVEPFGDVQEVDWDAVEEGEELVKFGEDCERVEEGEEAGDVDEWLVPRPLRILKPAPEPEVEDVEEWFRALPSYESTPVEVGDPFGDENEVLEEEGTSSLLFEARDPVPIEDSYTPPSTEELQDPFSDEHAVGDEEQEEDDGDDTESEASFCCVTAAAHDAARAGAEVSFSAIAHEASRAGVLRNLSLIAEAMGYPGFIPYPLAPSPPPTPFSFRKQAVFDSSELEPRVSSMPSVAVFKKLDRAWYMKKIREGEKYLKRVRESLPFRRAAYIDPPNYLSRRKDPPPPVEVPEPSDFMRKRNEAVHVVLASPTPSPSSSGPEGEEEEEEEIEERRPALRRRKSFTRPGPRRDHGVVLHAMRANLRDADLPWLKLPPRSYSFLFGSTSDFLRTEEEKLEVLRALGCRIEVIGPPPSPLPSLPPSDVEFVESFEEMGEVWKLAPEPLPSPCEVDSFGSFDFQGEVWEMDEELVPEALRILKSAPEPEVEGKPDAFGYPTVPVAWDTTRPLLPMEHPELPENFWERHVEQVSGVQRQAGHAIELSSITTPNPNPCSQDQHTCPLGMQMHTGDAIELTTVIAPVPPELPRSFSERNGEQLQLSAVCIGAEGKLELGNVIEPQVEQRTSVFEKPLKLLRKLLKTL